MQEYCHRHLDELTQKWHKKGYAVAGFMQMTIFEQAWYMRGLEDLFVDMMNDSPAIKYLLDKITEIKVAMARRYAEADVDVLRLGDDIGSQRGMLMSKELWRKWLKPRLLEVITAARSIKPDIHIFYHTDGKVDPVIPELIEIGIDILNPVQPECMDVYELHREYGKYLSFWGTIGTQTTMPFGTVKEVKEVARERIEKIGRFGGLVLGPTHSLQPDVPWENIVALFEAINEYKL
jgi:uroporphyrinogen decarboxylase